MGRIRASVFLLVSLGFVAAGGWMLLGGHTSNRAAATSTIAFFAACAIVFAGDLLPKRAPVPDPDGVTIIRPDRLQIALLTVAAGLIAGTSPVIGMLAAADGEPVTSWVVWAGTIFFGLGALAGLMRLTGARPLYRLDREGVASLAGRGWTIPWRAIRDIETFGQSGQNWLALDVDPDAGVPGGAMQAVNRAFGFPAYLIGAQGTGMRFEQLADLVLGYWARGRGW